MHANHVQYCIHHSNKGLAWAAGMRLDQNLTCLCPPDVSNAEHELEDAISSADDR